MFQATEYFGITKSESNLLGITFITGMVLGSYLWGYASDKWGRLIGFKGSAINLAVGAWLSACATNYYFLHFALVLAGAGTGGELSLGGLVLSEFSPPSKFKALTLLAAWWGFGGVLSGLSA